jgi:hypothetical protein
MCGRAEKEPPATWTCQRTGRGQMWLCEECTRRNVRSIEGKLDEAWW